MRARRLTAALLVASIAGCSISDSEENADLLLPDQTEISEGSATVTAILNAGVMAELGTSDERVKFLFDPLYDDHFGTLQPLDDALIDRIVSGEAPYDGVTAVFVSHAHGDHFSAQQFNRLMAAQPEIRLVAPNQAIEKMRVEEGWDPVFAARIEAISLENGEASAALAISGVLVEAFRSPHTGWPDNHANVHNLTYRVSAIAADGTFHRVMHFGDADPAREHYEGLSDFFVSARTGLAVVPYWHFSAPEPARLFDETFNAETSVGMHVPVTAPDWLAETGGAFFTEEGQQVQVPETP